MSFTRRVEGYFPSTEFIRQIEGIVIVSLNPTVNLSGVGSGVVAMVGEFADVSSGVSVADDGTVTTAPKPAEIFAPQDVLDQFGGWDETIGEFGSDLGNGFASIRNKLFARLILVAINTASSKGIRLWRKLPTNSSGSSALPVVPVSAAVVAAGREFKASSNRARLRQRVTFSANAPKVAVTDCVTTTTGPAASIAITSATAGFVAAGVAEGDIVVLGVIGGAGFLGANADTFRVKSVDSATQLTIEGMDGANISTTTNSAAAQPLRVHPASDADTGGAHQLSEEGGYVVPAQPLDATIATATALTPTVVPSALTATGADPLSGLTGRTSANAAGLVYAAAVQAANPESCAELDALYTTAIDSLMSDDNPERDINIVWCARKSAGIRAKLRSHELDATSRGLSRIVCVSPSLEDVLTTAAAVGDSDPGVGACRDQSVIYDWPGLQTFVPEAVGFGLKGADGKTYTDGKLDTTSDGWMAAILSSLAPERNPGQAADPVKTVMAPVLGFQRGLTRKLDMYDYIALRRAGIAAPKMDRTSGPIFQSGVTTDLVNTDINRRRFQFYIEDTAAQILAPFSKLPISTQFKDSAVGELDSWLKTLLSPDDSTKSRISDYLVDGKNGNSPALLAAGIYVVRLSVQMTPTADFIVLQAQVSTQGVTISAG